MKIVRHDKLKHKGSHSSLLNFPFFCLSIINSGNKTYIVEQCNVFLVLLWSYGIISTNLVFFTSLFSIIPESSRKQLAQNILLPLELYLLIKDKMYSLTESLFTRLIIAVAGDL